MSLTVSPTVPLTLLPQASGFTVSGGTTPATLTVASDANVSGTNTGDQTVPSVNSANTIPKSNGSDYGDSKITDDGNIIVIGDSGAMFTVDYASTKNFFMTAENGLFDNSGLLFCDTSDSGKLSSYDASSVVSFLAPVGNGTGAIVFDTSPVLTTPDIGDATATSINKMMFTENIGAGGTLAIASSKTCTISNTLEFAGTDGKKMTFPATNATIARTDAANTFTGHQTIEGVTSTGATGTGKLVFSIAPTLTGTTTFGTSGSITPGWNTNGVWFDLGTGGPSGIGSGGAGSNAWIGYAYAAGQWFTNSGAGDLCYRNATGKKTHIGIDDGGGGSGTQAATLSFIGSQNIGLGVTAVGTSGVKVLGIGNGTVPSTSPADMIQIFSVDLSAGNATLGLRTETAVVTETVVSDATLSVQINGTTYKICLKA